MQNIHIYAPQPTAKSIDIITCLDCKRRTRMISFFTPWYGWESTCIKCGRQGRDGEWLPLSFFNRMWARDENGVYKTMTPRELNIATAKRRFRAMPESKHNHYGVDKG